MRARVRMRRTAFSSPCGIPAWASIPSRLTACSMAFFTTKPDGHGHGAVDLPLDHRGPWRRAVGAMPMTTLGRDLPVHACPSVKRAPHDVTRSPAPDASAAEEPSRVRRRRRSLDARGAQQPVSLGRLAGRAVRLGARVAASRAARRGQLPRARHQAAEAKRPRFPGRAGQGRHRDPDHLHHRPWRRADDGAGDEGRRGRFPDQAVSRPGPARCRGAGAGARPQAARGGQEAWPSSRALFERSRRASRR